MGTSLDTRPDTAVTQIPGDFKRHPYTGAPMVPDPERISKPKGKKAELVAMCEAASIEVPAKATVPVIKQLLEDAGIGDAPMAQYGRPSSFGKQIENSTNLQKWAERMVALGVVCLNADGVDFGDMDEADPDDRDDRSVLDRIVVDAKRRAKADMAARRGTHTHELTEDVDQGLDFVKRVEAGEDLGLPAEVQAALVEAWEQMQSNDWFEILEVEAKVVDDRWRLAGTLDRIVRLKKAVTFFTVHGELVTLYAGTVLILDVKTGKLRLNTDNTPMYWHGYAVQVASYAQSRPFDPATNVRGSWPFEVDQKWAIIAHLDVLGALEEGQATCRLILVDLEAGREAGDLVVAAKRWEKRHDVFSVVGPDDLSFTVPVSVTPAISVSEEEPCPSTTSTSPRSEPSPGTETPTRSPSSTSNPELPSPSSAATPSSEPSPIPVVPSPAETWSPPAIRSKALPPSTPPPPSSASGPSSTTPGTPSPTTTPSTATTGKLSPTTDTHPTGTGSAATSSGSTSSPTTAATASTTTKSSHDNSSTSPSPPPLPGEVVTYAEQQHADLTDLARLIETWPEYVRTALARSWPAPDVLPYPGQVRNGEAIWTVDHLPLIEALFRGAEAPFNIWTNPPEPLRQRAFVTGPAPHPDNAPCEPGTLELLLAEVAPSGHLDTINSWLVEAGAHGLVWSPRKMPSVVNYERLRTALKLATFVDGDTDLALALIGSPHEVATVGHAIGLATSAETQAVYARIEALESGRATLLYGDDGKPCIVDSLDPDPGMNLPDDPPPEPAGAPTFSTF